jgi:hypothetical protein
MARELDVREFSESRVTSERAAELESRAAAVSGRLPGDHRVSIAGSTPRPAIRLRSSPSRRPPEGTTSCGARSST